ncbi:hypothetical protein ACQEVM_18310 [Streptomyces sp. CA-243310]|uniref:hypothetical protein n=1 Tax=Streptomyces sp. CA-243310 TaxID=3240056 RepID=UPI003D89E8B6
MKKLPVLVMGGALAAFTLGFQGVASAAPAGATAHPSGCTYQTNFDNGAMARCKHSNGGHYRATANCFRWDGGGIVVIDAVAWRSSGWSNVYCPAMTTFKSAGIVSKPS